MQLIQASDLDVAAIFPQCFDNQFVSFPEFSLITSQSRDFKDPNIAESRQRRTMMEINRSLVYGRQVCVNRASLLNCKPLYELYLPELVDEDGSSRSNARYQLDEFGELLRKRALVPYLIRGTVLDNDFGFRVDRDGQRALEHLLKAHDSNISFMTMGLSDEQIGLNATRMQIDFEQDILRLADVAERDNLFRVTCKELLPCAHLVDDAATVSYLRQKVIALAKLAFDRKSRRLFGATANGPSGVPTDTLSREDIYRAVLVQECTCGRGLESPECTCITDGRFARLDNNAVGPQFCIKALVDLVYATNIPDMLYRYALTPWELPTRNALQDYGAAELSQSSSVDDVARKTFETTQRLLAAAGPAMYLPMLEDLTLADIHKIRELAAWRSFMDAQENLLRHPLEGAASFADFQDRFTALQYAISHYWAQKRFEGPAGKPYRCVVSAAFQVGTVLVQWGVRKADLFDTGVVFLLDAAIRYVASHVDDRITVGPAKLLFDIIDDETKRVDAQRSWSIEWMRKQVAWERADLLALLNEERNRLRENADTVATPDSAIADVAGIT